MTRASRTGWGRVLVRTVLPAAALTVANIAAGRVLRAHSAGELAAIRWLQARRTPARDAAARVLSTISDVPASVALGALTIPVLRLLGQPWRRALAPALAMGLETAVYLTAGAAVDRTRPDVERLDHDQPTSSFPSGHVGANVALLVVAGLLAAEAPPFVRGLVRVLGVGYPAALAPARVYVGMHYPSDVIAGILNGIACGVLAWDALDAGRVRWKPTKEAVDGSHRGRLPRLRHQGQGAESPVDFPLRRCGSTTTR